MNLRDMAIRELERRAAETELCRRSLRDFVRCAWHVIEPSTPLVWGWHLDAICEHLEAVTRGEIANLAVTIPPGCTKSITIGVLWPVWVWIDNPGVRWLTAAGDKDLSIRDAVASRRIITSDWYKERYGESFTLTGDQNVKSWYENDKRGHRMAVSADGHTTGKKADILTCDDANDARKVYSSAERKRVHEWWDQAFYNRVNNHATGRRVIIGQRLHPDDLIGHVLKSGGFQELRIPEQFESRRRITTSIGWTDPRTADGEWLRPARFGPEQAEQARRRLGVAGYQAQHQQNPMGSDGNQFKSDWLKQRWRWDGKFIDLGGYQFEPDTRAKWITVDPTCSGKQTADHMGIAVWTSSPRGDLVWLDGVRERLDIPNQAPTIKNLHVRYKSSGVGIEEVAYQRALILECGKLGIPVIPMKTGNRDKLSRAMPAIILAETGRLWLPATGVVPGFPVDDVEAELLSFTGQGEEEDAMVDVLAYGAQLLERFVSSDPSVIVVNSKEPWEREDVIPRNAGMHQDWASKSGMFGMR